MKTLFKSKSCLIIGGLILAVSGNAQAGGVYPKTDAEFRLLPAYCDARLRGSKMEKQLWEQRVGKNFLHAHHYCAALNSISLARRETNMHKRRQLLEGVFGELHYVRTNSRDDNSLIPDTYLTAGEVHLKLGNPHKAIRAFHKAIELKPKQLKVYRRLADAYLDIGETERAREIINTGLQYYPESRSLKRRLEKIDKK